MDTTQQTQNICIRFAQRRPNVFDIGPTLYKCYTNILFTLIVARSTPTVSSSIVVSRYITRKGLN